VGPFLVFSSVLRLFKIVKTTRQPGGKNKQALKKPSCLCMLNSHETTQLSSTSFINKGNTQEKV
jgi:hypothetical protein